jgi:uncharacterized protein YkwD
VRIPDRIPRLVSSLAFVAAATAAATGVLPARAATAPCPAGANSGGAGDELRALLCLVNRSRMQHGLPELRESARLDQSSRLRALAIRRCGQLSHTACGQSFDDVFVRAGYHGRSIAENLGWGGGYLGSPASTIAAWCSSAPHRRNLFGRWREVGAALVHADRLFGARDVTVWVLQFGRP